MNQENNQFNQNNVNTQGNNGIPNNQPLNNQNFNATQSNNMNTFVNQNQQPINNNMYHQPAQQNYNNQPEPVSNYQQPINQVNMQQPTPQPVNNTSNSKTDNNRNLNNVPPKKKNLGLIIGIIAIVVAIILVGVIVLLNKDNNSTGTGGTGILNNNSNLKNNIKQIFVEKNDIIALSNDGDLYQVGTSKSYINDDGFKKLASNVENFYGISTDDGLLSTSMGAVYFIDKQKDLYYIGSSYNGGGSSTAQKDYSGVKDIKVFMNLCALLINENNELYGRKNGSNGYCGLGSSTDEFIKLADNAKEIFVSGGYGGYINNNNELFLISAKNDEFIKIADNVKSVYAFFLSPSLLFLANDNKLYHYDINEEIEDKKIILLRDDVVELNQKYFKTNNGEYNVIDGGAFLRKGEEQTLFNNIYYSTLDIDDMKEMIYYVDSKDYFTNVKTQKLVYLSNANKLVLVDPNEKKEIAYNTKNIKDVLSFISNP